MNSAYKLYINKLVKSLNEDTDIFDILDGDNAYLDQTTDMIKSYISDITYFQKCKSKEALVYEFIRRLDINNVANNITEDLFEALQDLDSYAGTFNYKSLFNKLSSLAANSESNYGYTAAYWSNDCIICNIGDSQKLILEDSVIKPTIYNANVQINIDIKPCSEYYSHYYLTIDDNIKLYLRYGNVNTASGQKNQQVCNKKNNAVKQEFIVSLRDSIMSQIENFSGIDRLYNYITTPGKKYKIVQKDIDRMKVCKDTGRYNGFDAITTPAKFVARISALFLLCFNGWNFSPEDEDALLLFAAFGGKTYLIKNRLRNKYYNWANNSDISNVFYTLNALRRFPELTFNDIKETIIANTDNPKLKL